MFFILLLFSLSLATDEVEINIDWCEIKLRVRSDSFILVSPNSDRKPSSRKYLFESVHTLKLVEGNYLSDHRNDQFLSLVPTLITSKRDREEKDYLYIISPSVLYLSSDFGNYRKECLIAARNIVFPVIRKFWLRHHIGWPSEFELTSTELESLAQNAKSKKDSCNCDVRIRK